MKTGASFYKIIGVIFLLFVISSLFMPFFQTITDGMEREPYRFIDQCRTENGFLTTYNGFGSLFGIFNASCSLALTTIILLSPLKNRILVLTGTILYLLSQLLMMIDLISAPYMLSDPDKLLSGYFLLSASEIGLFICLFKCIPKVRKFNSGRLLDDPE